MDPKEQTSDHKSVKSDKADCYSDGERAAMVWYQELREYWLGPVLSWLARIGIKPDHLTVVSLLLGLMFCPVIFFIPWLAFLFLLLHAIVDGLDGPMARHLGSASKSGSFTDTMCDQIVVVAVTVTMMCYPDHLIRILPGTIYIFLYTLLVVFAMVRNAMGIPYSWVIRPRLIVYAWLYLVVCWLDSTAMTNWTNVLLWIFNVLFILRIISGFFKIRANL